MSRVLEIRTYRLRAGTQDAFHALMRERSLPLLKTWGMDVVHLGPCAADPDAFVLMRAYDDAEHLRRSQEAFYASPEWREGPREAILACIDAYLSVVLSMDEGSLATFRTIQRGD